MSAQEPLKDLVLDLYQLLNKHPEKPCQLLDISDALLQVYRNIGTTNQPEALIHRLVQYIKRLSSKGNIEYSSEEKDMFVLLEAFGQQAGLNG